MMISLESYIRRGRRTLRGLAADERTRRVGKWAVQTLTGFLLSAASLRSQPLPLVLALTCAKTGARSALYALGGGIGYLVFWGKSGAQGVLWSALGAAISLTAGRQRQTPLLLPALSALAAAVSGLVFQSFFGDTTGIGMYLLRVALALGGVWVFTRAGQDPIARWMAVGLAMLALAQIAPVPYLGLGFLAAGIVSSVGAFPEAALAGLALDLSGVTPVPMAAVTGLCAFGRLLPGSQWLHCAAPGVVYAIVMGISGTWDLMPLPGLILGGALGLVIPKTGAVHRGETGVAQVRLELAAGVFSQTRQLLMETSTPPVDEDALLSLAVQQACGSCPCRKTCREQETAAALSGKILRGPRLETPPVSCKKSGRLLLELHRSQDRLRNLQADRERQTEYRSAVIQQYQFISDFVRELSDTLSRHIPEPKLRFCPKIAVYANRPQAENGDRCGQFPGTAGKYYVVLCDGMGTGTGAVDEGDTAVALLEKLLSAGYPAEHALRSLNSLCALRGRAGAVTVDLAELELDTGRAAVYKWGAAPSLLLTQTGAEKIGTAGPPPGLSVTDTVETVERLSLRRGETLLLLSDGVGGEDAQIRPGEPLGEIAEKLLDCDCETADDATVVTIRLCSASQST